MVGLLVVVGWLVGLLAIGWRLVCCHTQLDVFLARPVALLVFGIVLATGPGRRVGWVYPVDRNGLQYPPKNGLVFF